MKIDHQVVSIYNAIKLKEYHVPQLAEFFYENLSGKLTRGQSDKSLCAAYLTDELFRFIPGILEKDGFTYNIVIHRTERFTLEVVGNQIDNQAMVYRIEHERLADAVAALLIYLIEYEFLEF